MVYSLVSRSFRFLLFHEPSVVLLLSGRRHLETSPVPRLTRLKFRERDHDEVDESYVLTIRLSLLYNVQVSVDSLPPNTSTAQTFAEGAFGSGRGVRA